MEEKAKKETRTGRQTSVQNYWQSKVSLYSLLENLFFQNEKKFSKRVFCIFSDQMPNADDSSGEDDEDARADARKSRPKKVHRVNLILLFYLFLFRYFKLALNGCAKERKRMTNILWFMLYIQTRKKL